MVNFCARGAELLGISKWLKPQEPKKAITFFDVKELHNMAYAQKTHAMLALREYRELSARAREMDNAYRAQLGITRKAA